MLQQIRPSTPFPGDSQALPLRRGNFLGGEAGAAGCRGTAGSCRDGQAAGRAQGARGQLGFRGPGNLSLGQTELRAKCRTHWGAPGP